MTMGFFFSTPPSTNSSHAVLLWRSMYPTKPSAVLPFWLITSHFTPRDLPALLAKSSQVCFLKSGPPGSGYILSVPSLSIISLIWKLGRSTSSLEGFGLLSFLFPKFTGPVIHLAILLSFFHSLKKCIQAV